MVEIMMQRKLERVTFNRGAVRFPYNYDLDFEVTNRDNGFQALRSRTFLNSIFAFSENRNCSISPDTEKITTMVEARTDFLENTTIRRPRFSQFMGIQC